MNRTNTTALALALTLSLVTLAPLAQAGSGGGGGRSGRGCGGNCAASLAPGAATASLSPAEQASLLLMREEEKLARDVYLALGTTYDLPVFVNIPRAEQRHMDRVGDLLVRYGIADPVGDDQPGVFRNPDLQKLHDQLVTQGQASVAAALKVGATVEELDLADLNRALATEVDNADIRQVYANLAKGSRNHLRAFAAQLAGIGSDYEPRHLSVADYDAVVDSDWERGPAGNGTGRGQGQGRGCGRGQGGQRGCGRS